MQVLFMESSPAAAGSSRGPYPFRAMTQAGVQDKMGVAARQVRAVRCGAVPITAATAPRAAAAGLSNHSTLCIVHNALCLHWVAEHRAGYKDNTTASCFWCRIKSRTIHPHPISLSFSPPPPVSVRMSLLLCARSPIRPS